METKEWRYYFGCALILALISLVRPINVIVVFILPFLGDGEKFKALLTSYPLRWFGAASVFLGVFSIQPILNFLQCGSLFPWSYGEEGFFWTRPEIANVLFSFRKGLFIYTPVFFLVVISFWIGWKTNKSIIIGVLIIAICALYLISAWWSWYYGPGYAHRVFIDWYPVLFIPLVIGLNQFKVWPKRIYGFAISLCVLLNLFQTYQYEAGILEKEDMSAGGYKAVFLQWKPEFKNILAGEHELHYLPLDRNLADTLMEFTGMNAVEGAQFRDMLIFDKTRLFSPVFTFVDKSNSLSQSTMLRARLKIRELERDACRNTVLVLSVSNALGERVLYQPMRFRDYPDYSNPEREFTVEQLIRPIDAVGCKVDIYVFNPDTTIFALDEISVKIQSFRREIH